MSGKPIVEEMLQKIGSINRVEGFDPTPEEKLRQAQSTPCPIAKYSGKTLGEVLTLDPKAILWVANRFTGNQDISAAAKYLCDYALEQAAG